MVGRRAWIGAAPATGHRSRDAGGTSDAALDRAALARRPGRTRARLDASFPPPILKGLHETSGGNPFFALEIARATLRGDTRATGLALPIPRNLRDDLVRDRVAALFPLVKEMLLFASACSRPTVDLLEAALERSPLGPPLADAVDAGIVESDGGAISFTHPLYRSAIYADSSREHRHRVHRRLSAVVDDSERRARHLALAADGADEAAAASLEQAAGSARARVDGGRGRPLRAGRAAHAPRPHRRRASTAEPPAAAEDPAARGGVRPGDRAPPGRSYPPLRRAPNGRSPPAPGAHPRRPERRASGRRRLGPGLGRRWDLRCGPQCDPYVALVCPRVAGRPERCPAGCRRGAAIRGIGRRSGCARRRADGRRHDEGVARSRHRPCAHGPSARARDVVRTALRRPASDLRSREAPGEDR